MNLMVDLALDGVKVAEGSGLNVQTFLVPDTLSQMCDPSTAGAPQFVRMDGNDRMEIDPVALLGIDTTITLECWVRGDAAVLPTNTTLFEGVNAANQREVNVHLPWSNSRAYWDCGYDGGYDRIDQDAGEGILEGRWVHWAFTKDAETGTMRMFVNGQLWLTGTGKDNVIGEIARMNLGGSWNGDVDYYGDVASFRIWDAALTAPTLAAYMNVSSMDALLDHPHADDLRGGAHVDHKERIDLAEGDHVQPRAHEAHGVNALAGGEPREVPERREARAHAFAAHLPPISLPPPGRGAEVDRVGVEGGDGGIAAVPARGGRRDDPEGHSAPAAPPGGRTAS